MTYRRLIGAALFGLAIAGVPALAPISAQAEALRVVRNGTESVLNVPMNRAVVVESDTPFAELSIANPAIADISSLSDRSIYVLGKAPGATTLTLLDASGRLITNVEVRVAPDISEFKERLRQILPSEKLKCARPMMGLCFLAPCRAHSVFNVPWISRSGMHPSVCPTS